MLDVRNIARFWASVCGVYVVVEINNSAVSF